MIYLMRQKLFSWGDDFVIKDETGQDRFFVDGKAFSLGNQLSFQDSSGTQLAYISQRLLSWGPTYEISRDGQTLATVHKELFTFFNCSFSIEGEGANHLHAEGDFTDHDYVFTRNESRASVRFLHDGSIVRDGPKIPPTFPRYLTKDRGSRRCAL